MYGRLEKRFRSPYEYAWIILAFIPLINFTAFFWIGIYAKYRRWILYGLVYLAMTILMLVGSELYYLDGQEDMTAPVALLVLCGPLSWVLSPIHALFLWRPFLERSRYIEDNKEAVRPKPRQELQWDTARTSKAKTIARTEENASPENNTSPIDINTCTEQELASLPGIGPARAKEAVSLRSKKNGFDSVADFIDSLNVEPHIAVRIEKLVTVAELPTKEYASKRRRVDL